MRLLLWDCDDRSYTFDVSVSNDRKNWKLVVRRDELSRSWQYMEFEVDNFSSNKQKQFLKQRAKPSSTFKLWARITLRTKCFTPFTSNHLPSPKLNRSGRVASIIITIIVHQVIMRQMSRLRATNNNTRKCVFLPLLFRPWRRPLSQCYFVERMNNFPFKVQHYRKST